MDKRSLLFILLLTATLFCVNMFFEQRNLNDVRTWDHQQTEKRTEELVKLKKEVIQQTVAIDELPVVTLYSDVEAQHSLTIAIKTENALIALAWAQELPEKVYAKTLKHSDKATAYSLAAQPSIRNTPVIYRQSVNDTALISILPEFGSYSLQLVVPEKQAGGDFPLLATSYLLNYKDGHFQIPADNLAILQKELNQHSDTEIITGPSHDGILLLKIENEYLPVAIYRHGHQELEPLNAILGLSGLVNKAEPKSLPNSNQKSSEKFYVIETPYQQLVFSNYGGALVEINLPFESKTDQESVVKEIEIDREMVKNHPYNARFPVHSYFTSGDKPSTFTEHSEGVLGGYYPLLRRDLIEKDKRHSIRVLPRYYALNIVSEYPETASLVYTVKSLDKEKIIFEASQGHRRITKTFSVASEAQAPYCIDLTINIEGDSRGLWLTSGIPEVEWISGAPAPVLKYRITRNQKGDVETIELPKDSITVNSTAIDWACTSNGFLGMILDPLSDTDMGYRAQYVPGGIVPSRLIEIDKEYDRYKAADLPGYMLLLPLKSSGGTMRFRVFAGPFADNVLKTVDKVYSNPVTGYNPDYIACQSFHGWFAFISEPFAKFLFVLMNLFHSLTGSWAFSIVLLTVALRVMLYPLNAWSTKSMIRMQQISPEVTAIQDKYKKDPKKAQLEIMSLYRERGVNPVSGCLPLLIQMPFLIGMFDLLKSTFELRGASFIPGWIDNLTAPDVLFSWTMPIPIIGNQFHLLPILLGIVMFLQQRVTSTLPDDASKWTDQQRQQRFMGNIMAIVFTVMFYSFPSGLNIYWLSSMLLGMLQQWSMARRMKKTTSPVIITPKIVTKSKK